jgi:hypothetical protein
MTNPTREEFLGYVHTPLSNQFGDPRVTRNEAITSVTRYRWSELRDWDVETDAREYWDALSDDKHARLFTVGPGYWDQTRAELDSVSHGFRAEGALTVPFGMAFQAPHNLSVHDSSDPHALIEHGTQP